MAFIASAYSSFFLGMIFYFFGFVPPNLLSDFEKRYLKNNYAPKMVEGFQRGVSVVSDQQMAATVGILGAGFKGMRQSTVFEFQMIIYLAWMATNMHLSTLSILRTWFRTRPRLRTWKLLFMLASLIMMAYAIHPTMDYDWTDHTMYDEGFCTNAAQCFGLTEQVKKHSTSVRSPSGRLVPQGVFTYIILVISHARQAAMLFSGIHGCISCTARRPLNSLEQQILKSCPSDLSVKLTKQLTYRVRIGVYVFSLVSFEILSSWAFVQYLILVHLAWSSFQIFIPRFKLLPSCIASELGQWDFGRILPLLLLLGPIYSVAGYYIRYLDTEYQQTSQEAQHPLTSSPNTDENSRSPSGSVHRLCDTIFDSLHFKIVFVVFWFICLGGVIGYYTSAGFALLRHDTGAWLDYTWSKISWRLWPPAIVTGASFVGLFSLSILFALFNGRLPNVIFEYHQDHNGNNLELHTL